MRGGMAKILLNHRLEKIGQFAFCAKSGHGKNFDEDNVIQKSCQCGDDVTVSLSILDNEQYWILKVPAISHSSLRMLWKLNFQLNSVFRFSVRLFQLDREASKWMTKVFRHEYQGAVR